MSNNKYLYLGASSHDAGNLTSDLVSSYSLKDAENKLFPLLKNGDRFIICRFSLLPNGQLDSRRFYGNEEGIVREQPIISYVGDSDFHNPSSYKKVYVDKRGIPYAYVLGSKKCICGKRKYFTSYPYNVSKEVL